MRLLFPDLATISIAVCSCITSSKNARSGIIEFAHGIPLTRWNMLVFFRMKISFGCWWFCYVFVFFFLRFNIDLLTEHATVLQNAKRCFVPVGSSTFLFPSLQHSWKLQLFILLLLSWNFWMKKNKLFTWTGINIWLSKTHVTVIQKGFSNGWKMKLLIFIIY